MRTNWTLAVAAAGAAALAFAFTGLSSAGADGTNIATPGPSTFTVPSGVCSVNVNALGAPGGTAFGAAASAGAGGQAGGTVRVTPGESMSAVTGPTPPTRRPAPRAA